DPLHRRREQLRLGHEADLAADRRAEEEVVHEREVVRREDHRPACRDLLGGDPARAEERPRMQRGGDPHGLVDPVRVGCARALVEVVEVRGGTRVLVDLLLELGKVLLRHVRAHCDCSCSQRATEGTPPLLTANTMYQPGGARFGLLGSISSTESGPVTVNGRSSSRCSLFEEWVVADGRTRLSSRRCAASVVACSLPPYAA